MALVEEVVSEYRTSLADLHFNSKPLISMLTMLADDHEQHAPEIVKVIEDHINKCKKDRKLPVLYLMDSIMKNLGKSSYGSLFARNIVNTFTSVFEQVDEKTRASMFKLRQTWTEVLPNAVLYRIDLRIRNFLDPAWPITAKEPEKAIHVNPKFLQGNSEGERSSPEFFEDSPEETAVEEEEGEDEESLIRQKLIAKNKELIQLKEARLKLELAEAEEKLKKQKKQGIKSHSKSSSAPGVPAHVVPEVKPPPVDPRPRPSDPRLRDPRLKNKATAAPTSTAPSSTFSHSTFQPLDPSSYTSQPPVMDPRHVGAYNMGQSQSQFMAGVPYSGASSVMTGQVFSGEVFNPDSAIFSSEDNDSDSSRSSSLTGHSAMGQGNVRDSRDPRRPDTRHKHSASDKPHKHSSNEPRDPRRPPDPRRGHGSKERDVHSMSPRKSSSSSSLKHRSRSRERDPKAEAKQREQAEEERRRKEEFERKQFEEKERKGKEEERRKAEIEQKKKEEVERKKREEIERKKREAERKKKEEAERKRKEEMERRRKEEIERKKKEEAERKRKEEEWKQVLAKKVEAELEARKLSNSSKSKEEKERKISEKLKKKRTGKGKVGKDNEDKEEEISAAKKQKFQRETEKRSSGDKMDLDRAAKKQKLDIEQVIVIDKDCHEEDMDLESDTETGDVPTKIESDISDLFGGEDEDYRPVVQKLPLKSPSSKGWDQFKATHSDEYAYDIELKKMRQDSVTEQKPVRLEPEDEDLRVLNPEYQRQLSGSEQIEVPKQLSMDQHGEILIAANKQLTKGLMSHEQYQELVKQLSELVEIQKLQEHNRRLSGEMVQSQPGTSENDTGNKMRRETREVRSPDKPLDPFKIPKKRVGVKEEGVRVKSELDQLYPEPPVNKFGANVEPFIDTADIKRERDSYSSQPWSDRRDDPRRGPELFPVTGDRYNKPPGDFSAESRSFHGDGDVKMPGERRCLLKSPPQDFDGPPEVRSPTKQPYRDGRDWRSWEDEKSGRGRGGYRGRGRGGRPGRDFDRPEGNREMLDGPPGLRDERDWRDGRKERGNHSPRDFDSRDGRFPDRDADRFRDDRREFDHDRQGDRDAPHWKERNRDMKDQDRLGGSPSNWDHDDRRGPRDQWHGQGKGPFNRPGGLNDGPRGLLPTPKEPPLDIDRPPRDGPPLRDGPRDGPPFRDGPRDGPQFRDGPPRDGPPFRDGPPRDGPRDGPPFRDGPPRDGPRDGPPFRDGPPRDGPRDGPPFRDGPPRDGPRDGPPFRDGPPRDGPRDGPQFRDGPSRDEPRDVPPFRDLPGPRSRRDRLDDKFRLKDGPGDKSGRPSRDRRGKFPDSSDEGPDNRHMDSFIDKFGDPRFRCFADVGPQVDEEVAIGKRNYEIKVGGPPRKIKWFKDTIEVYADPSRRAIIVDNKTVYRFGEKIQDVNIRGSNVKVFYHGRPMDIWIEGQHYEVRVDAPPKIIKVNGKNHKIKIDGRDMMILIDNEEKGPFGGEPRFIMVQDVRLELRFEPPPKFILIDGNSCELKLNTQQPCVSIKGVLHGIRFDGPPRDIVINDKLYQIYTDHAVKLRVGSRFYYVALGGPCHELIIDGKWYELNFNSPPKEIVMGRQVLNVKLLGSPPEVKILPEIAQEPRPLPPGMVPPGMMMPGPGPPGMLGPVPPHMLGPDMRMPGPHDMRMPGPPDMRMPGPPDMRMPGPPDMRMPGPPDMRMPGPPDMMLGPGMGMGPPGMGPPVTLSGPHGMPTGMMGPPPGMMGPPPGMMGPPGPMGMGPPPPGMLGPGPPVTSMSMSGPNMMPGMGLPIPASGSGGPDGSTSMPSVLSSLFPPVPSTSAAPAPIDISSLFAKLVNTGIIKKDPEPSPVSTSTPPPSDTQNVSAENSDATETKPKQPFKEEVFEDMPDMTEMDPMEMKSLPVGMIQRLYSGLQCTSCGQRFATEKGEKTKAYKQHLDWHFRQNRKGNNDMKVTQCRKWYYGIEDWILYEEVVDGEETGKSNFFEKQQQPLDATPTPSGTTLSLIVPEGASIIRCPAATGNDDEDMCNICHEQFEQYWDEDLEEWHLRDAISVNNKTYHPICYEDHTDVSEGTPSPSVLNVTEPGFKSKRSLLYDESSQDAPDDQPDSSDEGYTPDEGQGGPTYTPTVKQEPEETNLSSDNVSVKTEPDSSAAETNVPFLAEVKTEPGTIPFLSEVKVEPGTIPFLSDDKIDSIACDVPITDIKVEPNTDSTAVAMADSSPNEERIVESPVKIKQEPADENQPSSMETETSSITPSQEDSSESVQSPRPVTPTQSHIAMETSESDVAKATDNLVSTETVSESIITYSKPTIELSDPLEETEEKQTVDSEEITPLVSSHVEPDSSPRVETGTTYLTTPEQASPTNIQHSPTYSMLNKVKLSVPAEPLDISPEVLEIESNASTPTRDELPSPDGIDS